MTEHTVFESRLRSALARHVASLPTDFDALEFARAVAAAEPRPRGQAGAVAAALRARWGIRPWWSVLAPPAGWSPAFRMAWMVALLGLLIATTVAAIFVGSALLRRTSDQMVVPPPTVMPVPSASSTPATPIAEGTDVLATTRAKPLPVQATCPPGTNPDAPAATYHGRPEHSFVEYGTMAFDRRAGRIVVLQPGDSPAPRTWTFDTCTNSWQRMKPPEEPGWDDPVGLVYDADSDRTLAFEPGRIWSYDLSADLWTVVRAGVVPTAGHGAGAGLVGSTLGVAAVYHDPSGLVIVYDGERIWAYDVETDTMTPVRQLPDPAQPAGAGLPDGVTAVAYDRDRDLLLAAVAIPDELRSSGFYFAESRPFESWVASNVLEIWAFDPATGSWELAPSQVPAGVLWQADGYFYGPVSRVVFDGASGATVFISPDGWLEAYDGQRSWREHGRAGSWCDSPDPVYDPLNGQIVCQVGYGGVSAYSTATGQWRWLFEPVRTTASSASEVLTLAAHSEGVEAVALAAGTIEP